MACLRMILADPYSAIEYKQENNGSTINCFFVGPFMMHSMIFMQVNPGFHETNTQNILESIALLAIASKIRKSPMNSNYGSSKINCNTIIASKNN